MKCHIIHNIVFLRNSLFILLLSGAVVTKQAHADIDQLRSEIESHLRYSPEKLVVFHQFACKFESGLRDFLDKQNMESLQTHITKLEQLLEAFKANIISKPEYQTVYNQTLFLHQQFSRLVKVLLKYVGKKNCHIALLAELKPYMHLVPRTLRDAYGPLETLNRVKHRTSR